VLHGSVVYLTQDETGNVTLLARGHVCTAALLLVVLLNVDVLPWMGGSGGFSGEPSPPWSSLPRASVGWDLSGVLDRPVVLDMLLDTRMTSIVQGGFDSF